MKLSGAQYRSLRDALVIAFPDPVSMAMMLQFQLNKNLAAITPGGGVNVIAFELIKTAQAEGWVDQLVIGARRENPGNEDLSLVAQELKLAPEAPRASALQRLIVETGAYLNPEEWRKKLEAIEHQVCRVETPFSLGTGFLVGPDTVITNYHVMQAVIETAPDQAGKVRLRFDYKLMADGATYGPTTTICLATDWKIDASPPSPVDEQPDPKEGLPRPDQLDYALLRLQERVGERPVLRHAEGEASPRGWIAAAGEVHELPPDSAMFIVQHPEGKPLKLALNSSSVIRLNENGTRVLHRTNTEAGSSGSPCFDQNWNLIALHHSGDPNFDPAHKPEYNQAVPFSAIRALLSERGLEEVLDL